MVASTSTLYCDVCGTANRSQARFCFSCGQTLQATARLGQSSTQISTVSPFIIPSTGSLATQHTLKKRYRVICQVGKGGMGAVYRAEDIQLNNRAVAIKEMSQSGLNPYDVPRATESFKQEAVFLAGLMHANLPRIYDHFTEDGRWYLIMDFIEGQTLEEYLKSATGGHLPVHEVLDIGIQLCTVLGFLHTLNPPIIFRDLKPTNVMIASSGHIHLIDFGIARHFKPGQANDTTHLGTVGYAAPEQYGKAQSTTRSDIFSLGATLHQLLSGSDPAQTPFRFASLPLASQPLTAELDALIMQMVELDENKRPGNITFIQQELQRIVAQQTSEQGYSLQSAGSTLRLTSIPIGTTLQVYQMHAVDQSARVLAVAYSPDGRYLASGGCDCKVHVWNANNTNEIITYQGHAEWVDTVAWSPDGRYIASAGADMTVHIWEALSGKMISIYRGHTNIITSVAWSPDGKYLASASYDHTVQIWHVTTCDKIFTYRGHSAMVNAVAWSPQEPASTGKKRYLLASASDDKTVQIWDIAKKRALFTYRGHSGWVKALAWSPNGTRIVSGSWDDTVQVWDTNTGNYAFIHRDHKSWVNGVAWSPISPRIASASNDQTVQVWHTSHGRELFPDNKVVFTYNGHTEWVRSVAWSPDGSRIASGAHDGTIRVWQAI
jgi:eukaryotic-like serine/threonine-protein kinase